MQPTCTRLREGAPDARSRPAPRQRICAPRPRRSAAPSRDRAQECQTNTEWNMEQASRRVPEWNMEQASRRVRQPHQLDSVVINVGSANNDTVGDSD